MRLGVVTPYVKRIQGNRLAFSLARGLAQEHEVTLYAHTVFQPLVEEVGRSVLPGRFRYLRATQSAAFRHRNLVALQLLRGRDRALAELILADHRQSRLDAVLVIANEGHWLGEYFRRSGPPAPPKSVVCVMDLIDNIFLLGYERPLPAARRMLSWSYPLIHRIEASRLRSFDFVGVISEWNRELLSYLYGIQPTVNVAAVAFDQFRPAPRGAVPEPRYIALPTVGVSGGLQRVALELHRRGIPFISFGPGAIGEIPYRGFVADSELNSILANAAATLFLFDYEALGLLPLESLAAGTPVVTFPKGGVRAELSQNPNVTFASNLEGLERACRQRLEREKSQELAAGCRSSVADYAPQVVARRIVTMLGGPT